MGCGSSNYSTVDDSAFDIPELEIVIVGDPGVGKSSICRRYCKNQFSDIYTPTTRLFMYSVLENIPFPHRQTVSALIRDVPGIESTDHRERYFSGVDGAIVVSDLTERSTIELSGVWKQEVMTYATSDTLVDNPGDIPIILLGNKYDLVKKNDEDLDDKEDCKDDEKPEDKLENEPKEDEGTKDYANELKINLEGVNDGNNDEDNYGGNMTIEKYLEEIGKKHNFTESVCVSAKDNTDSLSVVMRTFLQHAEKYRRSLTEAMDKQCDDD